MSDTYDAEKAGEKGSSTNETPIMAGLDQSSPDGTVHRLARYNTILNVLVYKLNAT